MNNEKIVVRFDVAEFFLSQFAVIVLSVLVVFLVIYVAMAVSRRMKNIINK